MYFTKVGEEIVMEAPVLECEDNMKGFIEDLINKFIWVHKNNVETHEKFQAMRHNDKDIAAMYIKFESVIAKKMYEILEKADIPKENLYEKAVFLVRTIEDFCHMYVIEHNEEVDYEFLKKIYIENCCRVITFKRILNIYHT